jgi:chromosome segregation ATPase
MGIGKGKRKTTKAQRAELNAANAERQRREREAEKEQKSLIKLVSSLESQVEELKAKLEDLQARNLKQAKSLSYFKNKCLQLRNFSKQIKLQKKTLERRLQKKKRQAVCLANAKKYQEGAPDWSER